MATQAGMVGKIPTVLIKPIEGWKPKTKPIEEPANPEAEKYKKMWEHDAYRQVAPGEYYAQEFLKQAKPPADAEIIDFGCGTGRGAFMLALFGRLKVKMLDFAANCLDPEVAEACKTQPDRISFIQQDLTKNITVSAPYGYCCDVMEHIPPEDVRQVLGNILSSSNHVFFGISTVDDVMGALIGEKLHLTVQPMSWWLEQLRFFGAVVHWSQEQEGVCFIYCSAWREASEIIPTGRINVADEPLNEQTKQNILGGWVQAGPFERQERELVILAGGPTMNGQIDKIRELREAGCALVTVNGSYHWALEHGLTPSAQVVLDAREFNSRFVKPQVETCRYLIASQVHPSTLDGLPKDRTFLWHSGLPDDLEKLVVDTYGSYYPVPGGSTVILRAIPLLRMLGYAKMHLFGFDSCVMPTGEHHSYEQKENDGQQTVPVSCGGRTFECTPWMVSQASEFRDLVAFLGDEVEMCVYGDGLIAHIIATGASLSPKEFEHGSHSMDLI